jgi:hypothetical protein
MVSFLFAMGLCALSLALNAQILTDVLPTEEKVQIVHLSNGVKTYVQEHSAPARFGSVRVIFRNPSSKEELYQFDGTLESLESFLHECKGKVSCPQEIAVVAVGDFSAEEMQLLIDKHFGSLNLQSLAAKESIRIVTDPNMPNVVLTLSYPIASQSIRTYADLKEAWKELFLQDLFQQRLERCSRALEKVWVHPHPRFFYPVNGYSLIAHEECEDLLSFFLWQVEEIRSNGFFEVEFNNSKHRLLDRLHYLGSRSDSPDSVFLASYFADQFLLGDRCLSLPSFMDASAQLIEEMKMEDLFPRIGSFLHNENRSIQVAYPTPLRVEPLTKGRIEEMIDQIGSLASLYSETGLPDDDEGWSLDFQGASPMLLGAGKPAEFQLANNFVLANNVTDSFYQLPITEKEKRIINVILTTMAEKNILQLAFVKRSMEKKGKKIEHIHPLRFIGHILSNSELRSCLRSIKKSSFKWDAFVDGFSRRMREEFSNNNLYVHVPGFCQQIGSNQDTVTRLIQRKDWEGLIKEHL